VSLKTSEGKAEKNKTYKKQKMTEETLEETVKRLRDFPGNVKGEVFRTHADYIRKKEGEQGLKKLEERMKELGAPINFDEIKSFEWISEGMSSLTIVVAKDTFGWSDEDVFEMGRFAPKTSFIIKVMIQYLVSMDRLFGQAEKYWGKHYDFGSVEKVEYDKENKKVVVREKDFKTHPTVCIYHAGYYQGLAEFAIKSDKISVKETACAHKGADYNEFTITWE